MLFKIVFFSWTCFKIPRIDGIYIKSYNGGNYESISKFLKHLDLKHSSYVDENHVEIWMQRKISIKFSYHVVCHLIENFSNCHSRMFIFGSSKSDYRRSIINFVKIAYLTRSSKEGMDRQQKFNFLVLKLFIKILLSDP